MNTGFPLFILTAATARALEMSAQCQRTLSACRVGLRPLEAVA